MSSYWYTIKTTYDLVAGSGKYWSIFLLALLAIYFLETDRSRRRRVLYPSILLCLFTITPFVKIPMYYVPILPVIAYAAVLVLERAKGRIQTAAVAAALALMVMMGGHFFFGEAYRVEAAMPDKIPASYTELYDALLALEDSPKAVLPPRTAVYARGYDSRIRLLYAWPENGDSSMLGEDVGKVYDQLSGYHPNSEFIAGVAREHGCRYIVYDRENHYAQFPLEDYGFVKVGAADRYDIYADAEGGQ